MQDAQTIAATTPGGTTPGGTTHRTRNLYLQLLILVLIALSFRMVGLGSLDPWEDEVYSYIGSGDFLHKQLMWTGERMTLHSPLPYIEVKFARALLGPLVGPGAFSLRFPAACYGTLAVIALYFLLRRLISQPVAFTAALILAVHPLALEWSRDARMYSHWLATTAIMMLVAHEAVRYAREDNSPSALNWRWWLLGIIFNWSHSSAMFAVTTIAAVGLWVGLVALANLRSRFRSASVMLLGAALATGVYLTSWSLNGIGRILLQLTTSAPPPEGADHMGAQFQHALDAVVRALAGEIPRIPAIMLVALAILGLIVLILRRRFDAALLLALVALTPWLAYPSIAKQHFFDPRYVIVELLMVCAGLAVVITTAITHSRKVSRLAPPILIAASLAAACFLWFPAWRNILTVPKIPYTAALAPINQHVGEGEALITIPEWYVQLGRYYTFPDQLTFVAPPAEARLYSGLDGDFESLKELGYETDFATVFNPDNADNAAARPTAARPTAAWMLIVKPDPKRLATLTPILRAFGLDVENNLTMLKEISHGQDTLTFRINNQGIDHITTTRGRPDTWWW